DEVVLGSQAELAAHAEAVHAGVKALGVRPGVDHDDLVRGHSSRDQAALDGLRDGDDGRDTLRRVTQTVEAVEGKAHPPIEHEDGDLREEARHHGESSRATLLSVDDLDAVTLQDAHERRHGLDVELGAHGNGVVGKAGRRALLRPRPARSRGHDHVMAPGVEAAGEPEELDGGAGEVVALRVELEDSERLGHFLKKARTAATTSSISDSLWPAEMGKVRICLTMRSVCSSGPGARYSAAGC